MLVLRAKDGRGYDEIRKGGESNKAEGRSGGAEVPKPQAGEKNLRKKVTAHCTIFFAKKKVPETVLFSPKVLKCFSKTATKVWSLLKVPKI